MSHFSLGFPTQDAANPVGTSAANPTEPTVNSTSKWSKIKIVTKQTGDECITAIEIVPPVQGSERHSIPINRPRTVARKFASIARSQVKRKRQMAAREKKVRTCKAANVHIQWKIRTVVPEINVQIKYILLIIIFNLLSFILFPNLCYHSDHIHLECVAGVAHCEANLVNRRIIQHSQVSFFLFPETLPFLQSLQ